MNWMFKIYNFSENLMKHVTRIYVNKSQNTWYLSLAFIFYFFPVFFFSRFIFFPLKLGIFLIHEMYIRNITLHSSTNVPVMHSFFFFKPRTFLSLVNQSEIKTSQYRHFINATFLFFFGGPRRYKKFGNLGVQQDKPTTKTFSATMLANK